MPRTNDMLVRVAVYLYPSEQGAANATEAGGTGFIVRRPGKVVPWHDYVITNRHNIESEARFVRVNTHQKTEPIDIFEGDWACSTTDDIAVCELPQHRMHYDYQPIPIEYLITKETARELSIGLGDDLFMVGRFINHDGKERNIPVLRFGTIAMMPIEPLVVDDQPQESFLIEVRTMPGFSGSPVFVHMPAEARTKDPKFRPNVKDRALLEQFGYLEKCLGIEWCRLRGETVKTPMLNNATYDIQLNTGMSGCIPAWKIVEFLETNEKLVMKREQDDKKVLAREQQQAVEHTAAREMRQLTTPKIGKSIEIPVPTQGEVLEVFKKVTRKRDKKD